MKLHHSQGCENGVFGGSQTVGLSWNLWAANVPCQDCRCSQCSQNFPSCGFAYEWQLCRTLSNPWEFNWGCNAHKQAKDPKDIGNSSSLIWMTFSTKKSVGSQILCYRFLVFQDKGNNSLFPFIFNVYFNKGTPITKDFIFSMSYPMMQLASTFWGCQCLMQNSVNIAKLITKILLHSSVKFLSLKNSIPKRRGISFLSVSTHLESFSAGIRRDVWIRVVSKYKGYWMKTHTSVKGNNSL